ncbi:MAG: transposase [Gemmatimonadales bacterium]
MDTFPTNPIFYDDTSARAALEALRWPNGPVCVHCGADQHNIQRIAGKTHAGAVRNVVGIWLARSAGNMKVSFQAARSIG